MLLRRHHAITQVLEQSTRLPFLYQTNTITRRYATGADAAGETSGRLSRPPLEEKRPEGNPGHRHHPRPRDAQPFREFIDHVPFEGSSIGSEGQADFEGTTITPREQKAFEQLLQLRRRKEGRAGKTKDNTQKMAGGSKKTKGQEQTLDEIMESAGDSVEDDLNSIRSNHPRPLQRVARDAHERRVRGTRLSQADAIMAAADKDLQSVSTKVDQAKTDVEVWDILQKHVFKRVLALNLDPSPSEKTGKKAKRKQQAVKGKAATDAGFTDLDVLTQTLQHHLTRAHTALLNHFPASPLTLNLLPHLRTLGPAAFAMGTSTQLYNMHMRQLYYVHLDLDGIGETLREMDEQVYEYDEYTENLIAKILNHARIASNGTWGEGVRRMWADQGMRKKVNRLFWWSKRVRERREEDALRRARAEEEMRKETGVEQEDDEVAEA